MCVHHHSCVCSASVALAQPRRCVYAPHVHVVFLLALVLTSTPLALALVCMQVEVLDMADYNPERLEKESRLIVLCSTWTDGGAPDRVAHFFDWVQYEAYDFRVGNDALKKLSFAVFGLGGALYMENFAKCTAELHESLQNKLGATALVPYSRGDDQTNLQDRFRVWSQRVLAALTGGHDGDGVDDDDDETSSVMSSSTVATSMSMASTVNGVKRPPRKEYQRQRCHHCTRTR